jgi:hypothetical protein
MALSEADSDPIYHPAAPPLEQRQVSGRSIYDYAVKGYVVARALHVIVQLGVADVLKDGTKSVDDLAAEVVAHPRTLYRVLRTLASVGLFSEVTPGEFGLTPAGAYLRGDVPGSMKALAALYGSELMLGSYGALALTLQTGTPACQALFGKELFAYLAEHPDDAATFNAAMTSVSVEDASAVLAAYDFGDVRTIVDVGGGHGELLLAILGAHPRLRGIVFDQPAVVAGARERVAASGCGERCDLVGGDFFAQVPAGADAYVTKSILWDFDDAQASSILRTCRRAMPQGGRLLVMEGLIPEGDQYSQNKLTDLSLLLLGSGAHGRSEAEMTTLLEASGFKVTRVIPTSGRITIFEGVPATAL